MVSRVASDYAAATISVEFKMVRRYLLSFEDRDAAYCQYVTDRNRYTPRFVPDLLW